MKTAFMPSAEKALSRFLLLAGSMVDYPELEVISQKGTVNPTVAVVEAGIYFIRLYL